MQLTEIIASVPEYSEYKEDEHVLLVRCACMSDNSTREEWVQLIGGIIEPTPGHELVFAEHFSGTDSAYVNVRNVASGENALKVVFFAPLS